MSVGRRRNCCASTRAVSIRAALNRRSRPTAPAPRPGGETSCSESIRHAVDRGRVGWTKARSRPLRVCRGSGGQIVARSRWAWSVNAGLLQQLSSFPAGLGEIPACSSATRKILGARPPRAKPGRASVLGIGQVMTALAVLADQPSAKPDLFGELVRMEMKLSTAAGHSRDGRWGSRWREGWPESPGFVLKATLRLLVGRILGPSGPRFGDLLGAHGTVASSSTPGRHPRCAG